MRKPAALPWIPIIDFGHREGTIEPTRRGNARFGPTNKAYAPRGPSQAAFLGQWNRWLSIKFDWRLEVRIYKKGLPRLAQGVLSSSAGSPPMGGGGDYI